MASKRKQYPFDIPGLRSKSQSEILRLRRQWDAFETVENYNFNIYNQLLQGNRTMMYYQFRDREELNDYKNGQELHRLRYPDLPETTFQSISEKELPDVLYDSPAPYVLNTIKQNANFMVATIASENVIQQNDMAIYTHVSTYNSLHKYQYNFPSNEEKLAYRRAEQKISNSK